MIDLISRDWADIKDFISLMTELISFETTVWLLCWGADALVLSLVFIVLFVMSATLGAFASGDVSVGGTSFAFSVEKIKWGRPCCVHEFVGSFSFSALSGCSLSICFINSHNASTRDFTAPPRGVD